MTISRAQVMTPIFSIPEQRCYFSDCNEWQLHEDLLINAGSAKETLHRKNEAEISAREVQATKKAAAPNVWRNYR